MKIRIFIAAITFIIPFSLFAQTTPVVQSFSLNEAVNYAVENSYDAKKAKFEADIRRNLAYLTITEGYPKINAKLDYKNNFLIPTSLLPAEIFGGAPGEFAEVQFGTKHNMDVSVEATQLLLDGRYFVGLKARKGVVNIASLENDLKLVPVKENVTKAYYGALVAHESKTILNKNLASTQAILAETQALYNEGLIPELDVDRIRLSLSNLTAQIRQAESNSVNANNALKFYMGIDQAETIELNESLESLLDAQTVLVENQVDPETQLEHQILLQQKELLGFDIKQKKAGYLPSLYGYAAYGINAQRQKFNFTNGQRWFDNGLFGISLNVPIFDGLTRDATITEAKIKYEMAKNDIDMYENSLEVRTTQAFNNYNTAIDNYSNSKENLALADKIHGKTLIMYKEGVGSSLELTRAETDKTTAQLSYIQTVYNLLISKADLNKTLGTL